jgi:hypothetical protein
MTAEGLEMMNNLKLAYRKKL